jgi:hypothetical protein
MNAENLMMISGIAAFLLTIYWLRNRELREKFAVAWFGVALLLLLCGLFPHVIENLSQRAHLAYPSAVLLISLGIIYLFSFYVSLSLSRQQRVNVRLLQELAILEERLARMERK